MSHRLNSINTQKIKLDNYIFCLCNSSVLVLGFYGICVDLFIKKINIYLFIWIPLIMTGVIWLILFLTSNVLLGLKGISFTSLPFYIPLYQLLSYKLEDNKLILKRERKSECEILTIAISIKVSDVKKVEDGMNHLAIKRI